MREQTPHDKTILIVEDDTTPLKALIEAVGGEGFRILVARDGEAGLKFALAKHPSLILLDIIMPQLDGMEMLKKLREDTWGKTAIVFILTNLKNKETILEAEQYDVAAYLVKVDWSLSDVVQKIKKELGVE